MITCQIEKPVYEELRRYMHYQVADAFPHLRGEQRTEAFTDKLYAYADFCFCRDEGQLVGMIAYYANGEGADFAYLAQVYVSPDYRRKGLCSNMLAHVAQDARRKGFHEIRLEVYKYNVDAQHFYMDYGFVAMDDASPETLLMRKTLCAEGISEKPKKLMLLGGIRYLLPVIKAAHAQGYYVITADNKPDNIAHRYSDEYVNVSIIDKEAVLKVAQEKQIDGIMSFGVDPGVVAASYVQNQMGLPSFGPFKSIDIMQNKDKFRAFLQEHGFNVPQSKGFDCVDAALKESFRYSWPVIVKPADSAGSKGVMRVDNFEELQTALDHAMSHSLSGRIIVEEYLDKRGCTSDSDCMSVDGKLVFTNFNAQRFDAEAANPYTPAAFSWPSTFTREQEEYLASEIQRLITLLNLKTAVYNIEVRVSSNGKAYIMEMSARGGGNRLSEMIRYATGVDMITAITRAMVGDPIQDSIEPKPYNGYWAEIILHANEAGTFERLEISKEQLAEIVEEDLWVKQGEKVYPFDMANKAIGTMVLKYQTAEEQEYSLTRLKEWLKVITKKVAI